tara:strand:+ start:1831 stop:2718 length:888 start_codon:yes stop_codon:yes gene_type:complete
MSEMKQSVVVISLEDAVSQLKIKLKENEDLVSFNTVELLQKDAELLRIKKEIADGDAQLSKMQSDSVSISEQINALSEKIRVENVRIALEEQEKEQLLAAEAIVSLTKKRKVCEYHMAPGETCTTKCYKGSVCAKHAKSDSNQRNIKEIGLFATRSNTTYGDQTHLNLDSGDPTKGKYTYCITLCNSKGVQFRNSVKNNPNVVIRLFYRENQSSSFVEYKVQSFNENNDNDYCRVDLTVDPNGCDVGSFKPDNTDSGEKYQCHFKKMALLKFYDDPKKNINSSFNTTFGVHYKKM